MLDQIFKTFERIDQISEELQDNNFEHKLELLALGQSLQKNLLIIQEKIPKQQQLFYDDTMLELAFRTIYVLQKYNIIKLKEEDINE